MIHLRHLLLPTDFSDTALQATRYAVELARRFQAVLHLLHVIEDPFTTLPLFDSIPGPSRKELEALADAKLRNWIQPDDAAGLTLEYHAIHGHPFVEIVVFARQHDIDLIVLGTHGRGVVAQMLLGSHVEQVVRTAPCPVLTVRPDGHQFIHPGQGSEAGGEGSEVRGQGSGMR